MDSEVRRLSPSSTASSVEKRPNIIDRKYIEYLGRLDYNISRNFRDANVQTRLANCNGLWCCLLLPALLLGYTLQYEVTLTYKMVTCLSIGLLVYSIMFIIFVSVSCLVLQNTVFGGCMASSLISALLIYGFLGQSLQISLSYSMASVFSYSYLLRKSLTTLPKTFTVGEAMVVHQGLVLFTAMAATKLTHQADVSDEDKLIHVFLFTVFSTVGLIVTALALFARVAKGLTHLCVIVLLAVVYALVVLHVTLGPTAIPMVLRYVFKDEFRWQVFALWLFLVLVSIAMLVMRTQLAVKATTVTRKTFHVLASLVFMSGIVYDVAFMKMAAGFGLGVIVFVEALRKSKIEPISSALQKAFYVYSDDKDCGVFALTPIYLYMGLAMPLAICPENTPKVDLLAGVLAAGVGDSAAAWAGQRYGTNTWPDGNKTIEGTAFNICSQIAVVYFLDLFELLQCEHAVVRTSAAGAVAALVEAHTHQVDNLVLPLVMLLAFQITHFLS